LLIHCTDLISHTYNIGAEKNQVKHVIKVHSGIQTLHCKCEQLHMQHHLRENFQPLVLKPVHTLKSPPTNEVLLQSEIPSGMCAELRTVAASNNRDHPARSLSSSPLASTINCSPGSQALLEVTHQDHSIGITLLLLVRATYIMVLFFTHIPLVVNHTINATPLERLQQHPLLFTTNRTDRTFFV